MEDDMRLKDLKPEDMTDEQRLVAEEAIGGKRGHLPAPLRAWLHSPEMGARAQRLGEFVRYDTSLEPRLSELAILVTARFWSSRYEWNAHKIKALEAGLEEFIVEAIRLRQTPFFASARDQLVYDYAYALHDTHFVSDTLHAAALELFGERGLAELVGIIGYYTFVAMTLNAFEIGVPDGQPHDFDE
jgi:4-carboxymuconolactone decarboxylase